MSWNEKNRINDFKLIMKDNQGNNLGEMKGLELGGSVTYEYQSDLRRIAKISTTNDNYVDFSLIEILVKTTNNDEASLGTFCVKNVNETKEGNIVIKDYDLASVCYKAQTYLIHNVIHLKGVKTLKSVLEEVRFSEAYVLCKFLGGCESATYNYGEDGVIIDEGTDLLSYLSNRCSEYNCYYYPSNSLINIKPYINPSTMPSIYEFSDKNGTISGSVTITKDSFTSINEAIVSYHNNEANLIGYAVAPSSSKISPSQRGQTIGKKWNIDTLAPETQENIDRMAVQYLKESMNPNNSYEFTGIYCGLNEGDVVDLLLGENKYKCVIVSEETNVDAAMATKYKLKEVF